MAANITAINGSFMESSLHTWGFTSGHAWKHSLFSVLIMHWSDLNLHWIHEYSSASHTVFNGCSSPLGSLQNMELEDHGMVAYLFVLSTYKRKLTSLPQWLMSAKWSSCIHWSTPPFSLCLPFFPTFTSIIAIKIATHESYTEPINSV